MGYPTDVLVPHVGRRPPRRPPDEEIREEDAPWVAAELKKIYGADRLARVMIEVLMDMGDLPSVLMVVRGVLQSNRDFEPDVSWQQDPREEY